MGNRPEFFACWFGAALAGAVMVPMNPQSTVHEFAFMLDHSKCTAVIAEAGRAADVRAATAVPVVALGADFDGRGGSPQPASCRFSTRVSRWPCSTHPVPAGRRVWW